MRTHVALLNSISMDSGNHYSCIFFFLSVDYGTYFDPLEGMLVLIYLMTADLHSSLQRGCSCFENQQCLQ